MALVVMVVQGVFALASQFVMSVVAGAGLALGVAFVVKRVK